MKKGIEKDLYFVAVKVFLEDAKGNFFITKDRFGDWDVPGGRLRREDFETPLTKVIERKIKEELGKAVRYSLVECPPIFMRHERNELLVTGKRERRRIFAIGYRAKHLGGTIRLGSQHVKSQWVSPKKFRPEKYFKGGWLKGVKEYTKIKRK